MAVEPEPPEVFPVAREARCILEAADLQSSWENPVDFHAAGHRPCGVDRHLLRCRGHWLRIHDSLSPRMVRLAHKACLDAARLGARPHMVGALSRHGVRGVARLAQGGILIRQRSAYALCGPACAERLLVGNLLQGAQARTRLCRNPFALADDSCRDAGFPPSFPCGGMADGPVSSLGSLRRNAQLFHLETQRLRPPADFAWTTGISMLAVSGGLQRQEDRCVRLETPLR